MTLTARQAASTTTATLGVTVAAPLASTLAGLVDSTLAPAQASMLDHPARCAGALAASPRAEPGVRLAALGAALLLVLAASLAPSALAAAIHPHDDILATVEAAALHAAQDKGLESVEVRVRPLDQRLRPTQCAEPLEIVRPHAGRALGPVSYGVRCSSPKPWTLYLRADVSASMDVPVLREPLPRGALIGADDLEVQTRRITSQASDLILDPARAVGRELKRSLAAGAELRYGYVALPRLVSRGQTVTLIAGADGLEVRMKGKAMTNAAEGDRLLVTNLSSGRRVEGIVLADGSVRIH